ncbi:nucleoside hydrolase [Oscillibacter valericigenes]|jgi:pyrimidine-specific ribonucleoside hydrolase|uniref:nucleoside hydrolase n=1 Tax=Oscillibacter ruminantium TaxID=1263547 RepID=UPI0002ED1E51|nr:nucleoside hydrolase [Oscillibacter ruminantium]MDN0033598.1 nucleoside hydrolase [Oscillibacter valericigenes]
MTTLSKLPVILDGDPGHDDAMAWMLANASPMLDILAVTSVAGNQTIEKTTYNARRVCALLGIDAPIAMGRPGPLLSDPITAGNIHGQTGLDGPALPEPNGPLSPMGAVELMAKTLRESPDPVIIIATGPETNVAALLLAHPELKSKIAQISVMGGGIAFGNWTPAAEFNILVDPEAAQLVFSSGIPLTMSGLDVTEQALIFPEDFERIRKVGNQVAGVVADWLEFFFKFHRDLGYAGAPVHDAVAVAALLRPELFTIQELYVQIETAGEYCRGATVGDLHGKLGRAPNARCVLGLDRTGFVDLMAEAVKAYDGWEVRV